MRRLILLRHAKAEPASGGMRDFDRPLAAAGQEAARRVGAHLAAEPMIPDRVLVSPSRRTQETWDLVAAALGRLAHAEAADTLYEATAATILALVQAADPDAPTLLLVGHNPGFAEAAHKLLAIDDTKGRALVGSFPVAGLAVLDFEAASWREVAPGAGRLAHMFRPSASKP